MKQKEKSYQVIHADYSAVETRVIAMMKKEGLQKGEMLPLYGYGANLRSSSIYSQMHIAKVLMWTMNDIVTSLSKRIQKEEWMLIGNIHSELCIHSKKEWKVQRGKEIAAKAMENTKHQLELHPIPTTFFFSGGYTA